jgi:membrane-bound lytic murein transglycosylase MltF
MAQARVQALAATRSQAKAAPAAKQLPATPDGYKAYALAKVGAAQFSCLNLLWTRESHWQSSARNPASTAYGIAQLLDSTWRYTGVAKTSDGFRQVDAGLAYVNRAYPGGPCGAWAHEKSVGWY